MGMLSTFVSFTAFIIVLFPEPFGPANILNLNVGLDNLIAANCKNAIVD